MPGDAQNRRTAAAAVKAAAGMARTHPGAVAFSRTGDFAPAEVIKRFGDVPNSSEMLQDA